MDASITPTDMKSLSGHDDGEVLADGTIARADFDDAGNLVGWHKEPAEETN